MVLSYYENNNKIDKIYGISCLYGNSLFYVSKLKSSFKLQTKNHTEDWSLGSHPRDNGQVTH